MAHLWYEDELGEWTAQALREPVVSLPSHDAPDGADADLPAALLLRSRTGGREEWLILNVALQPLSINGQELQTGIKALSDLDEIRGRGIGRLFFSTEKLPTIESYAAGAREVRCPRCHLPIEIATPVVICTCNVAFHMDAAASLECWSYGPTCPQCGATTDLTPTYRWQPGDL